MNLEISFSLTDCYIMVNDLSLTYYSPIAERRIRGSIPFPRVIVLCEMQTALSMIWTRVVVSISYDCNRYTTNKRTIYLSLYLSICGVCVIKQMWQKFIFKLVWIHGSPSRRLITIPKLQRERYEPLYSPSSYG